LHLGGTGQVFGGAAEFLRSPVRLVREVKVAMRSGEICLSQVWLQAQSLARLCPSSGSEIRVLGLVSQRDQGKGEARPRQGEIRI
jgi:hypothetical protein